MTKLVRENLEEKPQWYRDLSEWGKKFVDDEGIEPEFEDDGDMYWDVDPSDLASFVDSEWGEMTGLSNRDKDQEGYFPGVVESLMDDFQVHYDSFSDAWGMQREGTEDWEEEEPVECDKCGEEFPEGEMYDQGNGELWCENCEHEEDED